MGKEVPRTRQLLPTPRTHEDNHRTNIQITTQRTLWYYQNPGASTIGVHRKRISQGNEGSHQGLRDLQKGQERTIQALQGIVAVFNIIITIGIHQLGLHCQIIPITKTNHQDII